MGQKNLSIKLVAMALTLSAPHFANALFGFGDATTAGTASAPIAGGNLKSEGNVSLTSSAGGNGTINGIKIACEGAKVGFCMCGGEGGEGKKEGGSKKALNNSQLGVSQAHAAEQGAAAGGVNVSQELYKFMDEHIANCLKKIPGCEQQAKFCTMGGHADRPANTPSGKGGASRHSTGDAIDLSSLECNGKKIELTQPGHKQNAKDYEDFGTCWNNEVEQGFKKEAATASMWNSATYEIVSHILNILEANAAAKPDAEVHGGGGNSSGSHCIACEGAALKPQNALHNNHMHISVPAPRPGSVVGI